MRHARPRAPASRFAPPPPPPLTLTLTLTLTLALALTLTLTLTGLSACVETNPAYEACQEQPEACAPLERCDGEDQDLDGQVDEGLSEVCLSVLPNAFNGGVGFGRALVAYPDLDGDGFDELFVSSAPSAAAISAGAEGPGSVFLLKSQSGEQLWAQQRPNGFGAQLAVADLNGDGAQELVASMPLGNAESAAGLFVFNPAGELVSRVRADRPDGGVGFGLTLSVGRAPTGQVSLVTSEPAWDIADDSRANAGRILGFTFGADLSPQLALSHEGEAGQRLGERVLSIPDNDGDGADDLLTTVWVTGEGGGEQRQVWVLSGANGRALKRFSAPEETSGTLGEALSVAPFAPSEGPALVFSASRSRSSAGDERGRLFILTPNGDSLGGVAHSDEFGASLLSMRAGERDLLVVGGRGRIYIVDSSRAIVADLALNGDEVPSLAAATRPDPDGRTRLWVGLPNLGFIYTIEVR